MVRLDAVTLKQLRALTAVAETASLTQAAGRLGLTPSAIHSQIKNLETAIGRPLFERGAGQAGLRLTSEGETLRQAAARVEVVLSHAAAEVQARAGGREGVVTLGVVSTAKYIAPRLVRLLKDRCPGIDVRLQVGNRGSVIAALDRQALDLAIMGRPPRAPEVDAVALGPHPHGIVAPPDHRLVGRPVSAAELLAETFIGREEGSGTRILMTRYLDRIGEGQVVAQIEMDSNETIKQAVIAGLGIAFLSLHTVMDELKAGRLALVAAPGLPIERHWFLVHPRAVPLSPAAERLQAEIVALEGTYLPH